jgi:antirestriction protein
MARIYVASLADYNNGLLHGEWIDLDGKDADDVQGEIAAMLRASKCPNVTVECPRCDGDGEVIEHYPEPHIIMRGFGCPDCAGSGEVPSAEEWSIHDYDDCPDMGENPSIDDLLEQVRQLDEHGDAWTAYVECVGSQYATESGFEDARAGEGNSELDWLYGFIDDTGLLSEMPENLRSYFDHEAYLRDMKGGGDVCFEHVNGTVYAFWNH